MFKDAWRKLSNKSYREHYALSLLKRSVAFQIKTLRKKHCGIQGVLAERSNLKQGVISRAEDQEYGNLTFNTVGRIAAGLDMAFVGRFVPFSELLRFSEGLSEEELKNILTFEEEEAVRPALEALGLSSVSDLDETYRMSIPIGPMPIEVKIEFAESEAEPQNAADAAELAPPPRRFPPSGDSGAFSYAQAG